MMAGSDLTEQILPLVSDLHEGVDNDERWLAALDRLSSALGDAAMLIGSTRRDGGAFELSGHRVGPDWIELVNGRLASHDANPVFATVSRLLRDDPADATMRPFRLSELLDESAYHDSPVYREAIAPAGLEYVMVVVLDASSSSAISLTLARSKDGGNFSEDECRLAATIGPHLLSAMRLRYRFAIARGGALMLDCIERPVLLLGENGGLVHANREGQKLLAAHDGLDFHHGRLRGATTGATRALAHIVGECERAARGASLAPAGVARIERPSGLPYLVVRAQPLAGPASATFGVGAAATVVLTVHDPAHQTRSTAEIIASGLGLSRAEAAVAARIWDGDSVAEAAEALGLSANTVKTHLKTIFEAIGVHRQSGLVRRIAMLLSDLGPDPA